jgi:hypothetical protein
VDAARSNSAELQPVEKRLAKAKKAKKAKGRAKKVGGGCFFCHAFLALFLSLPLSCVRLQPCSLCVHVYVGCVFSTAACLHVRSLLSGCSLAGAPKRVLLWRGILILILIIYY